MDYRALAAQIAEEEGVDPALFTRLIEAESSFRPDVTSSAGAYGLAQLMPGTAAELGVDPSDPIQNLRGGARYLRQQLDRFGDPEGCDEGRGQIGCRAQGDAKRDEKNAPHSSGRAPAEHQG